LKKIVVVPPNSNKWLLKWYHPQLNSLGFINPGLTLHQQHQQPTTLKMWENVGNMISTFPDFLGNTLGFHDERPHFVAFPTIFTSLVDPYRFLKSSWTLDTLDRLLGALGKSCGLR
jgi:hypothetical protein